MLRSCSPPAAPINAAVPPASLPDGRVDTPAKFRQLLRDVGNITPAHYGVIDFKALERHNRPEHALLRAAGMGDLETVTSLVESGVSVYAHFDNHESALHRAAERGHGMVVEFLLNRGANLFGVDEDGTRPRRAAELGKAPHVVALLDQWRSQAFESFDAAVKSGNVEWVKTFSENTSQCFQRKEVQPLLREAAVLGNLEVVEFLLEEYVFGSALLMTTMRELSELDDLVSNPAIRLVGAHTEDAVGEYGTEEQVEELQSYGYLM